MLFLFQQEHCAEDTSLHLMGLIIEINEQARSTTKSDRYLWGADAGVNPQSPGQDPQ